MARRDRPQRLLLAAADVDDGFLCLDEDGWESVKMATPPVTSITTRYL